MQFKLSRICSNFILVVFIAIKIATIWSQSALQQFELKSTLQQFELSFAVNLIQSISQKF